MRDMCCVLRELLRLATCDLRPAADNRLRTTDKFAICNLQPAINKVMDTLFQQFGDPLALLLPLAYGLAAFALLLLIRRLLRPYRTLEGVSLPYLLGALVLCFAIGLTAALNRTGAPIDPSLRNTLLALLIFCWGFVGLGLAENLLLERWIARGGRAIPRLARDIGRVLAFIVVVLLVVRFVFEVQLSSIVISSTILSAVIALALQDLLKNVFAGIALQTERPFEVGHWVEINRQIGRVVEMSWRATRVITVDGNYIIYPNSSLAQTELINYTIGSPIQAMHVQIGVAPHYPPNLVKRVLSDAALASPDVCREPPPSIKVHQYGDYSVTYDVKFWLYSFDRYPEKRDSVLTSAWYHLNRAGIKLPFPIRQVYMHQVDPISEAAEQRERIAGLVADLRRVDLFAVLDDAELRHLAGHVQVRLFGKGEMLVRQGEVEDTFFIIRSGRVRVDVDDDLSDGRTALTVNHLGPGEFFGEMALLTGEPRGATVVAEVDTETLVVAQADIAPLLAANHELPERLGTVLARRMEMNQAVLASRDDTAPVVVISRPTLVHRIRQLFGLDGHADAQHRR
jgi:small-conductance mechanosensitive channel/CRP-like cAMP-binding protein